mgnify:CR=1 FL=1
MNNILITVDKRAALNQIHNLKLHMEKAARVSKENSYTEIQQAKGHLYVAKGIFGVLKDLRILINWEIYNENLIQIEEKHREILWDKRRR